MRGVAWILTALFFILTVYLCFWPVPVQPVSWQAPTSQGYTGAHAPNKRLANLETIQLVAGGGPEHIVLHRDGKLYAAVDNGNILYMAPDGTSQEVFVNTGGRVLGFDFDAAGNLIAADVIKGLLSISPSGKITVLTAKVGTDRIHYANSVVAASSGKIYFSDASTRFAPALLDGTFEASILDIMEQSSTGRILEYDPFSRSTRIVAKGLSFANGVALSHDEQTLFVCETGKYRVWKIAAKADNLDVTLGSPQATVIFENLPGFPDNLMRGLDGRIWLGFVKPRNPLVDVLANKPFLRKLILRLPRALWPVPKAYGHVMAFTEEGQIVADLQDPSGVYPETTSVTETKDRLYVQSLHAKKLAWLAR